MSDTLTVLNSAELASIDASSGRGLVVEATRTSSVTYGATETVIMSTASMTWVNNRAYKVTALGLHQYPTTANYAVYRIRKGTTTAGTQLRGNLRITSLPVTGTDSPVFIQVILTNTTGADISTAVCLTGMQGTSAQTWTWTADATTNISYLTVEDCGSAANYTGSPIT